MLASWEGYRARPFVSYCDFLFLVEGIWTSWGGWSSCSTTCGQGTKSRLRGHTDGLPCTGSGTDTGKYQDCLNCYNCPAKFSPQRLLTNLEVWVSVQPVVGNGPCEMSRSCKHSPWAWTTSKVAYYFYMDQTLLWHRYEMGTKRRSCLPVQDYNLWSHKLR